MDIFFTFETSEKLTYLKYTYTRSDYHKNHANLKKNSTYFFLILQEADSKQSLILSIEVLIPC